MSKPKFFALIDVDGRGTIVPLESQDTYELDEETGLMEAEGTVISALFDRRNLRRIAKEIEKALS